MKNQIGNKISAVFIVLNEEENLPRALGSIDWVDEIVVADTGSNDNSIEIARKYTTNVHSIEWKGFGDAYNQAMGFATKDWILFMHADEEMTPELKKEIIGTVNSKADMSAGYYIARLPNFLGYWLRHGDWYPSYEMRLFQRGKGRCNDRAIHQDVIIDGKKRHLKNHLLHYTDPTLDFYIDKMNRFTSLAAKELYEKGKKSAIWDLIIRPPVFFLKMFVSKRGFLDGIGGLIAAILSSNYVFVKYLKLRLLRQTKTEGDIAG
ncbi:MAG: glycosyltransferase [candidate division Zixibacteria bacterium]|nr:glycosyltransferase [candidate division Zixibacteria bacterium]